jgi:hypothetical protein
MNHLFPRVPLPPELAYEFLGTFARSEYALKCAGFATGGSSKVEANWDEFAKSIDWHFRRVKNPEFIQAVEFLLTEPPRKQVLRAGQIEWKQSPPDRKLPKAQQVVLMVRRVRNNMFHGAKVWSPEYDNRDRDIRLVTASLTVLKECMKLSRHVQLAYDFGAF